jgi:IS605 OrfB family transposase
MRPMVKPSNTRTFETRLPLDPPVDEILHECAHLFAHIRHRLFADISAGKSPNKLKSSYLIRYGITARHFNALRVQIEGKIASIKKRRPALIAEKQERISSLLKTIKNLTKKKTKPHLLHQKKRRLKTLEHQLGRLQEDHKNGTIRCCFGTKKRFRAQFNLEENGYTSHEQWQKEWKKSRASEIFFLGSKDETSGNQTCTATLNSNQTLDLRIRLPNALKKHGKYLLLTNMTFNYGKEELHAFLKNPQAISWRLLHDKKGWRLFATFDIPPAPCISKHNRGVIGLDINNDHLALVETDSQGNPLSQQVLYFNLYGKSSDQAKAAIGDATASAIAYAETLHKPLIFENLDFQKKKASLREKNHHSHSRMLSSFSYSSITSHLKSRAMKKGVLTAQVNPAYTSIIGRVKFATRYGLSIHQAAALTIGRRYLNFSEKVPSSLKAIPDGKESHVTLSLPVRNDDGHVWRLWNHVSKKFRTALAAHLRTAESRSRSPPKRTPETELFS